jgi:hypothetical protein
MNSAATIWPNPGAEGLYIQLPLENELGEIKIYSSSGKEVLVENGIAQTVIFCEGNDWAPGVYFIHWRAGDGKQGVMPWVKQ